MGNVTIKSFHSGISLILDANCDFTSLLEEVGIKFEEARKFFKDARVALSIDGRVLNDEEEKMIIQTINEHCDVQIICLIGKNEETERKYVKALKRVDMQNNLNNARLYEGDVNDDDVVEAEGSLIILGDVNEGGVVSATGNIVVLGGLYGMAMIANTKKDAKLFVASLDMNPQRVSIGGMIYKPSAKGLFGKKSKTGSLMIISRNERLEVEDFSYNTVKEYFG